jgi:Phage portal protein
VALVDRIARGAGLARGLTGINPLSWDAFQNYFSYGGLAYPFMRGGTLGEKQEEPEASFEGYVQAAYRSNGVIFACMLARLLLFSEARFQFRRLRSGRPGNLFGSEALRPLETPWPNATTGDLLARMEQDSSLAGNFYCARWRGGLRRMRPDWVTIILGSMSDEEASGWSLDADVLGYVYKPGGARSSEPEVVLLPEQVCHYAPIPDPIARFRGMSWLTPVIRELMGDNAATTHKLRFFENGATPNMVTKINVTDKDQFEEWIAKLEAANSGLANAYRTMYLAEGMDSQVVGSNFRQIDFKATQGHGETRIAAAAGVPPVIVGLSEGLEAATYSNYAQARRRFADGTMRPLWRNACGSLASIIDVPPDAELWYDDRDVPFLQEDQKDAAEIRHVDAQTLKALTEAGYTPESAQAAVLAGDMSLLKHSGKFSVQLREPSENESNGEVPKALVPGGADDD